MKSIWKKIAAVVLAAVLCLSFAGCYSENNTWAARKGDETMPIGGYIYYLSNAYSEASAEVPTDTEVLKGTIDGKPASDWIRDKAMESVMSYFFISDKFNELGLKLADGTEESARYNAEYMESLLEAYQIGNMPSWKEMGVATDSVAKVEYLYYSKYQQVMQALYGEGGEMEIPEDELKDYFVKNYYNYEYFSASLYTTDENGERVEMSDDEKDKLKLQLEKYVKDISAGDLTVEEAAKEYHDEYLDEDASSTFTAASPTTSVTSALEDTVKNGAEGSVCVVESDTAYYVLHKLAIADSFEDTIESESGRQGLVSTMKDEEFEEYVKEKAGSVSGVELNKSAMNGYSLSRFVTDGNKNGASSASSSEEE